MSYIFPPIKRRDFCYLSGLVGLGIATLGVHLLPESLLFDRMLYKVSDSRVEMGTYVNIILLHPSRWQAEEAMGQAFQEIHRLVAQLTCHQSTSYIGQLNAKGHLEGPPQEVMHVLRASIYYHGISYGAFDITVKPMVDLYQQSFQEQQSPPPPEAVWEIFECVGSKYLLLNENRASFARRGMGITLDGIAKGYIIDRALALLRRVGIRHALIDAGGDIACFGGKGRNQPWRIALQDPCNSGRCLEEIELQRGGIATSGSYEVFFDQEKFYHHLISPGTGMPAQGTLSATIIAASAMEADALATALFILGPDRGSPLIRRLPGVKGLFINHQQEKNVLAESST